MGSGSGDALQRGGGGVSELLDIDGVAWVGRAFGCERAGGAESGKGDA